MAEGPQPLEIGDKRLRHLPQLRLRVELQLRDELLGREMFQGILAEAAAEGVEVFRFDLESRGHFVPAEGVEKLSAVFQGAGDVEAVDRSSAALTEDGGAVGGAVGVEADHDGRLAELIDDARGDDADDARMPAVAPEDDGAAIVAVKFLLIDLCERRVEDAALHRLPLAVVLLQLGGDLQGTRQIRAGEHFDGVAGVTHTADGVEARGEAKADVVAVEVLAGESGGLDQGANA